MECKDDYKLDMDHSCHYRYTLLIVLTSGICVTIFIFCLISVVRSCALRKPQVSETFGSVLDQEATRQYGNSRLVANLHDIGKDEEDLDISVVSPSRKHNDLQQSFVDQLNESVQASDMLSSMQSDSRPDK